jgi:hypothetical protein
MRINCVLAFSEYDHYGCPLLRDALMLAHCWQGCPGRVATSHTGQHSAPWVSMGQGWPCYEAATTAHLVSLGSCGVMHCGMISSVSVL